MLLKARSWATVPSLVAGVVMWGCSDAPTRPITPAHPQLNAVKFWETATTRWNERAVTLLGVVNARQPIPNGQGAASRILTYLSIAQYRAVLAAEADNRGSSGTSASAAVSAASAVVLRNVFPADAPAIDAMLTADRGALGWPGDTHRDAADGEAIGRAVAASVLAQAASDHYLSVPIGTPPAGTGLWVWNGAPVVPSLHGARPFFLTSASQLRSPAPPAFGSPAFLAALAEVRQISDTRTTEQLQLAQLWAGGVGPFTIGALNLIADATIRTHHGTEREAARILAYGNAATFDANIACWDAKLFYWYIRPVQADPAITIPISQPNHPSYPSGHSCVTSAIVAVLIDAFPTERNYLEGIITDAGLSRIYGGLHYGFDIDAGQAIGRAAAALALGGSLE
jgi:membrane-associated phospholipid phosphatase